MRGLALALVVVGLVLAPRDAFAPRDVWYESPIRDYVAVEETDARFEKVFECLRGGYVVSDRKRLELCRLLAEEGLGWREMSELQLGKLVGSLTRAAGDHGMSLLAMMNMPEMCLFCPVLGAMAALARSVVGALSDGLSGVLLWLMIAGFLVTQGVAVGMRFAALRPQPWTAQIRAGMWFLVALIVLGGGGGGGGGRQTCCAHCTTTWCCRG